MKYTWSYSFTKNFFKKSISIVWCLFFFLLSWSLFAQWDQPTIGNVVIRFCNDDTIAWGTKSLLLSTTPWQQEDICLYLANKSQQDLNVSIDFVDGTRTLGDNRKACKQAGDDKNFGQFVTSEKKTFTIPAQDVVQHTISVEYPESFAGMSHGCITAQLTQEEEQSSMVSIVQRRANFIDIFVQWDITLWLITKQAEQENGQWIIFLDTIKGTKYHTSAQKTETYAHLAIGGNNRKNTRQSTLSLQNIWSIAQHIESRTHFTPLWWDKQTHTNERTLLPGEDMIIKHDLDIPRYQTFGILETEIDHKAQFDFDSDMITEDMNQAHTMTISRHVIILPYKILLWLLLLVIIAIIARIIHHRNLLPVTPTPTKRKKTTTKKSPTTKTTKRNKATQTATKTTQTKTVSKTTATKKENTTKISKSTKKSPTTKKTTTKKTTKRTTKKKDS